ncbi:hypothetical protein Har1131_18700 [Haloarcula sp. CBA1131]|uniref:hypothetical protein n=1 Tax=Haloarcula sp. CBA1131 TaxID=1853686 RepID=UPI00124902C3|nr:hypothetical protein [Haloarcula sp. CBA1131]KAA9400708.1 hypothetical protein Har1131_18700 [Haloarcula sp. CBA1131]
MSDTSDPILDTLPPERLLEADHFQPIVAGINCMHSIETIQQYLAYENQYKNRTPVQSRLRERAREIRRDEREAEGQVVV